MNTITSSEQETLENTIDMKLLLEKLIPVLTKRVKAYHELFSLPLIAEQWEETLHRSLQDIGYNTTWKPDRSHAVGEDMRIIDIPNTRISCKSGQFINSRELGTACVKFNGSRSTSHETLEEKIKHFSDSHDDYYFMLSKNKEFDNTYKLLVFESTICKVDQLLWTESKSGKAWNGTGKFVATIGKAMSSQLWTTLPLNMIVHSLDIDCR